MAGVGTAFNGGDNYAVPGPLSYVTTDVTLQPGMYYACFYALRVPDTSNPTPMGMDISPGPAPVLDPVDLTYSFSGAPGLRSAGVITDFSNWTRINNIIPVSATAPYHITIGNPSPIVFHATPGNDAGYYFIDNVGLYRLPTAGPDAYLTCNSAGVTLGEGCGTIPDASYQWLKGPAGSQIAIGGATSPTLLVNPNVVTTYTLRVTLPIEGRGPQSYATSTTVHPAPAPVAGPDITVCSGSTVTLTSSCVSSDYSYQWLQGPSFTRKLPRVPTSSSRR